MGCQNWWFGDPRTLLYRVQPLYRRVQWFLGHIGSIGRTVYLPTNLRYEKYTLNLSTDISCCRWLRLGCFTNPTCFSKNPSPGYPWSNQTRKTKIVRNLNRDLVVTCCFTILKPMAGRYICAYDSLYWYLHALIHIIFIYLEPQWPLFLKVNPPKQGLFHLKQGSFGF